MAGSNAHRNVSVDITGNADDLGRAYDDAMRKSKKFNDEVQKGNKDNEDGIKRVGWATKKTIEEMGGQFKSLSMRQQLIVAAIVASFLALGHAATLVAGTITLAFGAALAGIGVMAALESGAVRGEFSRLWSDIKEDLSEMAQPIEQALFRLPDIWRRVFSLFAPDLDKAFALLGPTLDVFFERFSIGFAELAPAIGPLVDGFKALLDAIGLQAPALFGHLSDAITSFADTATDHADDFASMLTAVFALVSGLANYIDWVADAWNKALGSIESGITWISGGNWQPDLDNSNAVWQRAVASIDQVRESLHKVAVSMDNAKVSAATLANEINTLTGANLNADLAALAYAKSLEKATMSAKDGADGLALYRHQGQLNVELLLDLAKKSHDYINAKAEEGLTVQELRGIYETHRQNLHDVAVGMGASETKAKQLTDRYLRIPKSIMTRIDADTQGAQNAVDNFITLNSGRRIPIDVYNRNAQLASGGLVGRDGYATGGPLRGPGGSRTDSIPINASRGEFIMNASATRRYLPALEAMNSGKGMAGVGGMTVVYQINTTVAPTANLAAVGGTIVEAIQSYEQRSGRSWRQN